MRMTYKAGLLGLMLGCALAAPARAQETNDEQTTRLMHFAANNAAFDTIVESRARDVFKGQIPNCPSVDKAIRQLPTPYGEIVFPPDPTGAFPYPTRGLWAEHVKVKACNQIWTINMLAVSMDKGAPMLLALMPGDTLGDPAIQRNAERIGATAIKKADAESCADDALATYTRILGFRQQDGTLGKQDTSLGWFEEWTYRFCQRDIPVQMAYLPNDKGGYEIKARIVPSSMPKVPEQKPTTAEDVKPVEAPAPHEPSRNREKPADPAGAAKPVAPVIAPLN